MRQCWDRSKIGLVGNSWDACLKVDIYSSTHQRTMKLASTAQAKVILEKKKPLNCSPTPVVCEPGSGRFHRAFNSNLSNPIKFVTAHQPHRHPQYCVFQVV